MAHGPQENPGISDSDRQIRVARTLDRVLASPSFRNSRQCQKFLRYVVEHTLSRQEEMLRERVIGAEVFGREHDYDTAGDAVVRIRATEVRKRLAQYYQESATPEDIKIDVPAGSYRVEFHSCAAPAADAAAPARSRRRRWVLAGIAVAAIVLAVAALLPRLARRQAPTAIDRFWGPALSSPKSVLLYCGQPVVYFLSRELRQSYLSALPAGRREASSPVQLEPDAVLHGRDIIPVTEQFVGIGNAHTAALLSTHFAVRGKPVEIRYANDLSFADLRSSPSILIGAFSNLWTLEMTRQLRFVFEQEGGTRRIRDRSTNRTWELRDLAADGRTPEDYAVVSRLIDSATGQFLMSAAGITQYGTRAAGEFLTDGPRLEQVLRAAPTDWPKKNIQVLLHTTVFKGTPAVPSIVATHVW